jgi:prepilin-type N-terminal cleavage/methylation domain-containing protein
LRLAVERSSALPPRAQHLTHPADASLVDHGWLRIGALRRDRWLRAAACERGFTMVEILVAILVLVVAVLGVASSLISSQKLSLVAERGASITQRAQGELERLEALPYGSLAMSSAPSPSTNPYVSPDGTFAWDRNSPSSTEPFVVDTTNGLVSPTGTPWSDSSGRLSGYIYDFVTWHSNDPVCGSGLSFPCQTANDYKRVTVVVTLTGASEPRNPALVSALVVDPNAAPAGFVSGPNGRIQLQSPSTSCVNAQGTPAPCGDGLGNGTPQTWFLYDTPATSNYAAPIANHPTHATVACPAGMTSGCPIPDLMDSSPPAGSSTSPLDYSSEQTGDSFTGGRIVKPDVGVDCSSMPSADNSNSELWVSPPLAASTAFTGEGGMTIYSETANNATAGATLCIAMYDVSPNSFTNLVGNPPTEVGAAFPYYAPSWPTVLSPISFPVDFASGTKTIPAGDRVGVRVWITGSSADIAIAYDNPNYPSQVELNEVPPPQ